MRKTLRTAAVAAALAAGMVSFALAQPGPAARKYDPKTEVTVAGTVQEVKTYPSKGSGAAGEHLHLKTPDGVVDVPLGPSDFLKAKGFDVAAGDAIEVTGSKLKVNGADAIIARQVKKGEKTWTLRSASGVPEWSHGPKGR
jgi:hypothetical protein